MKTHDRDPATMANQKMFCSSNVYKFLQEASNKFLIDPTNKDNRATRQCYHHTQVIYSRKVQRAVAANVKHGGENSNSLHVTLITILVYSIDELYPTAALTLLSLIITHEIPNSRWLYNPNL